VNEIGVPMVATLIKKVNKGAASGNEALSLARFFAFVAVTCLPLTSVFALGQFFTISFCFTLLAALFGVAAGVKINQYVVVVAGFIPFSLLIVAFISFIFDNGGAHASGIEIVNSFRLHLFLLIYACCLGVIINFIAFNTLLKWITIGVIFSAVFGLVDYFLQNYTSTSLDNYVYRFLVQENSGTLAAIFRLRSTFAEPGLYAFFLAILAPWAFIYLRNKPAIFRRALQLIVGAAFLLTFSATGYAILTFLTLLLALRERRMRWLMPAFCVLLAVAAIQVFALSSFAENATRFLAKYDGNSNDTSLIDRSNRIELATDILKQAWNNDEIVIIIFGHGPGWVTSNFGTGLVNTYLYLLVEFGVVGFISVISFFVVVWWKIVRRQDCMIWYSFFAMVLSLALIQNYYEIMITFVFALLAATQTSYNRIKFPFKKREIMPSQ